MQIRLGSIKSAVSHITKTLDDVLFIAYDIQDELRAFSVHSRLHSGTIVIACERSTSIIRRMVLGGQCRVLLLDTHNNAVSHGEESTYC